MSCADCSSLIKHNLRRDTRAFISLSYTLFFLCNVEYF